jgi:hypothetical protein
MTADSDKLLDAWLAPDSSGDPVACVTSTFTFDAGFFDEECLARFLNLDAAIVTGGDETDTLSYVLEREARLENARATVLVDRSFGKAASTFRWDVIPVTSPSGGVQHSKVSLLMWENRMRLIVASANLTRPSYRTSIEVFSVLDDANAEVPSHVFEEAIEFLRAMLDRHTHGATGDDSPRGRAQASLRLAKARIARRQDSRRPRRHARCFFIHGLRPQSLLQQAFTDTWGDRSPPSSYLVTSPFFDRDSTEGLDALTSQLKPRGTTRRELAVKAAEAGEGQVMVEAPEHLRPLHCAEQLVLSAWPSDAETARSLHAKIYVFANGRRVMAITGSPNASGPGLGLGNPKNIEAAIAISDHAGSELGERLADLLPQLSPLPEGKLVFDAPAGLEEEDRPLALPAGFVEALYHPDNDLVEIALDRARLPERWWIRRGADVWHCSEDHGDSGLVRHELGGEQAPRSLTVEWEPSTDEEAAVAELVVAVANAAQLPDPPEIQKLTLEELLDLLAVGGRLHDLLRRLVNRRIGPTPNGPRLPDPLDPHERVDTSGFMLQRTRRTSYALEGLKRKLSDPIANPDALERRLRGPFGATGLKDAADRAVKECSMSPRERSFLLAELALVLARVEWKPVGGGVSLRRCRSAAKAVLKDLKPEDCGDDVLDSYVNAAFEEAL